MWGDGDAVLVLSMSWGWLRSTRAQNPGRRRRFIGAPLVFPSLDPLNSVQHSGRITHFRQCKLLYDRDEPVRDGILLLGNTKDMVWLFERIRDEWFGDAFVQHSPAELVRLFDLVEVTFGEAWMRAGHGTSGVVGPLPTLRIAFTGQPIEDATDLLGSNDALNRLRTSEPGSQAELLVIAII